MLFDGRGQNKGVTHFPVNFALIVLYIGAAIMATEFKLLVLLMAGIVITECSIVKFPSKESRLLETEPIPIEDIHKDIAEAVMLRAKRATDTPTYNKSDLNDTNIYGNVQYSGGDSNVSLISPCINNYCHFELFYSR